MRVHSVQIWRVAALLSLAAVPAGAAPVRWEVAQGGNGHFYELVEQDLSWPLARVAAAQRTPPAGYGPGHLASFSSAAEEAFLDSGWIGFTDELVEGEWRWIDATPGIWPLERRRWLRNLLRRVRAGRPRLLQQRRRRRRRPRRLPERPRLHGLRGRVGARSGATSSTATTPIGDG